MSDQYNLCSTDSLLPRASREWQYTIINTAVLVIKTMSMQQLMV